MLSTTSKIFGIIGSIAAVIGTTYVIKNDQNVNIESKSIYNQPKKNTSPPTKSSTDTQKPEHNELTYFKKVFIFADTIAYLDMTTSEAKKFADWWMKQNYSHEQFELFKSVFIFADTVAYLDKNTDKAKEFALNWIDKKYTKKDFSYFKETFIFADATAYMNMSTKDAEVYALKKLKERLKK